MPARSRVPVVELSCTKLGEDGGQAVSSDRQQVSCPGPGRAGLVGVRVTCLGWDCGWSPITHSQRSQCHPPTPLLGMYSLMRGRGFKGNLYPRRPTLHATSLCFLYVCRVAVSFHPTALRPWCRST